MQAGSKVLVYVQAVPQGLPSDARKFSDLSGSDFVMTHSSKNALAKAQKIFADAEITAAGYHSILHEALTRGASKAASLPLCDDPLDQAKSFPSNESYSYILVGENPDGFFSGASLCGALFALRKISVAITDLDSGVQVEGVYLVRDSEGVSHNIDIRRINSAFKHHIAELGALGTSSLGRSEQSSSNEDLSSESPEAISSAFSRRLRRLTVQ